MRSKIKSVLVTAAVAASLAFVPMGAASARTVSDVDSCPAGRFLTVTGSSAKYVMVVAGSYSNYMSRGSGTASVTVKSYQTNNVSWRVTNNLTTNPSASLDCPIS